MADFATLVLGAVTDGLKDGVRQLDNLGKKAEQVEGAVGKSSGKMVAAFTRVATQIAATAAAALSVGAYVKMADAWSDMQSKIGAAVKNMEAAPALMQRMVQIANASYSPLQQTVEVYSRNVVVLTQLGYSADRAADFTESLNHMLVITATKGEQAANVQQALARAMALGKLSGDGLESVMASGGRVAEALATQLGTTTLKLREFASEGKITSEVIGKALVGSLEQVRKEAGAMSATVADGFQRITTGSMAILGTFDQVTGISGAMAEALVKVGDHLANFATWISDNADSIAAIADGALGAMTLALKATGVILAALVATQLPSLLHMMGLLTVSAWTTASSFVGAGFATTVMTVQFGAGALAARAMAASVGFLSGALNLLGGPIGIAVGLATALVAVMWLTPAPVTATSTALETLKAAQEAVNGATADYSNNKSKENVQALKDTALQALNAASALLVLQRAKLAENNGVLDSDGPVSGYRRLGAGLAAAEAEKQIKLLEEEVEIRRLLLTLANNQTVTQKAIADTEEATAVSAERTEMAKKNTLKLLTDQVDAAIKAGEYGNDLLATMQAQEQIQITQLAYGVDSAEATLLQNTLERDTLKAKLEQQGVSGTLLDMILAQHDASKKTSDEVDKVAKAAAIAAERANDVADGMGGATVAASRFNSELSRALGMASSLASTIGSLNFSNIGLAAKLAALKGGATPGAAQITGDLAQHRAELEPMLNSPTGASKYARQLLVEYEQAAELQLETQAAIDAQMKAIEKGTAGAAGSVTGVGKAYQELMGSLDPVVAAQKKLTDAQGVVNAAFAAGIINVEQATHAMKIIDEAYGDASSSTAALAKLIDSSLLNSVNSVADVIGKWASEGFKNTKGLFDGIRQQFKDLLADLVSTAISNPIRMVMGFNNDGTLGTTGLLGGVGTALKNFGGGLSKGLDGVFSAFSTGGLTGMASDISTALKGATSSLVGFGTAIGTIAGPIAAVALIFEAFKKTTTVLAAGLNVTLSDMSTSIKQFETVKTSTFFGLFSKTRTTSSEASEATADPINRAVLGIREGVLSAAASLGFASDTFRNFTHAFTLSTKGLTQDQAIQAIQQKLTETGDAFASMIPGLELLRQDGEGASDTLARLSASLAAVQGFTDTLGLTFDLVGLRGAAVAAKLVDAFGTLNNMVAATNNYFRLFYSQSEQVGVATRQATAELVKLGLVMPETRAQYRAMIDSLDLTTESGQKTFTVLIGLAGAMDLVLPKVEELTSALAGMLSSAGGQLDEMISGTEAAIGAAVQAASSWYGVAKGLREFIAEVRGAKSDLTGAETTRAYNEAQFQMMLAQAMAGSQSAYKGLTGAASALLNSTKDTASTSVEAALQQARILADLNKAANVADLSGAKNDAVAGLLGEQLDILTAIKEYLAGGGVLNPTIIDGLNAQLGSLQDAIADVQATDYATIVTNMGITATLVSQVTDPVLQTLLQNSQNALERDINFFANTEGLTPNQLLLAFDAVSTTDRTIKFLAENTQVTGTNAELALLVSGEAIRAIKTTLSTTMTEKDKDLALAVSGGIVRNVEAVLKSELTSDAVKLALQTDQAIVHTVDAFIKADRLTSDDVRLGLGVASNIVHTVDAVVLSGRLDSKGVRLALAESRGLLRRVDAILPGSRINSYGVRVALAESTDIMRGVDAKLPGDRINSWGVRVALAESGLVEKKVNALFGSTSVTEALELALAESDEIKKRVVGEIDLSKLTLEERNLLDAISGSTAGSLILGGSFLWDPSTGFQTWLEETTQGNIADPLNALIAPMTALRVELTALTTEIRTQNAAAAAEAAEAARVKALAEASAAGVKLLADRGEAVSHLTSVVSQIDALDAAHSTNFINNKYQPVDIGVNADGTLTDNINPWLEYTSAADLAAFRAKWSADGGLQDQLFAADAARAAIDRALEAARQQVIDLGGVPTFARGGMHSGGFRIVGERGPELEATGPSRIYSAGDTARMMGGSDNAELIRELRELRAEVKKLKDQDHEFASKDAVVQRRMAKLMEGWDADGLLTRT